MVTKSDNGRCVSEDARPRRGMDTGQCTNRTLGPDGEGDCEVPHRLERGMSASKDVGP